MNRKRSLGDIKIESRDIVVTDDNNNIIREGIEADFIFENELICSISYDGLDSNFEINEIKVPVLDADGKQTFTLVTDPNGDGTAVMRKYNTVVKSNIEGMVQLLIEVLENSKK